MLRSKDDLQIDSGHMLKKPDWMEAAMLPSAPDQPAPAVKQKRIARAML